MDAPAIARRSSSIALSVHGIQVRVDFSFARVLNGFSAAAGRAGRRAARASDDVAGVYPVRVAYPASLSSQLLGRERLAIGLGSPPEVLLPGLRRARGQHRAAGHRGRPRAPVPARADPGRHQRRRPGGAERRAGRPDPDDPSRREDHGTEMAGLLVGAGGPGGISGVATGASVLPIRIAGWQLDADGQVGRLRADGPADRRPRARCRPEP